MKAMRSLLDQAKPHFVAGGKLEKLHYAYDAFETFLFVPGQTCAEGTHIRDGIDLKRTMFTVVLALLPCLFFGIWNTGHQHYVATGEFPGVSDAAWLKIWFGMWVVLPIVAVSYGVGLSVEFLFAILRGHPVNEGFLVTGMLIPLIVPPTIPLWMVALATIFAVVIGKEVFGGTGMNILNVALVTRVFLFFAYPAYMAGDNIWIAGDPATFVDGFSGATPLAVAFRGGLAGSGGFTFSELFYGTIPGSIGETSAAAILIGAAVLIATGIGSWQIMVSVVAGAMAMAAVFYASPLQAFQGVLPHEHLVMGSLLFAAVFMATDPVTAAQTARGKIVYGLLIGVAGMLIRVTNPAYPEGWMLAILLMNVFAPAIDHVVVSANIKRRMRRAHK
jgi:Na+-transporting NADH:ubiquinone oxidoreductase subunit B